MVTGATNGIGKAMAHDLATSGFNLVLIGRSEQALESTKQEIAAKNEGATIETRRMDFMETGVEDYRKLQESVKGLDIAILVNNAGVMSA